MQKLKPIEYLAKLDIQISAEVESLIKTPWDLDCVMDATYIYDTDYVDKECFLNAQEVVHNYFNGNIEDESIDLSLSPTASFTHYVLNEIPEDTIVAEVELDDESRYYELPE